MMDNIPDIETSAEFQERVLSADRPVLVTFYAQWCEDSQELAPSMGDLAAEYAESVEFAKVDIDQATELRDRYEIEVTPTVFLFNRGRLLTTWLATPDPWEYRRTLNTVIEETRRSGR
jgi:thioredoxin 1